ncbi:MAG: hypothetical protein LBQ34_01400 [Alphaproteobacteria bacterium]|nr:hypothetical protein [Alphaproteobacteria bacterium]
MTPKVETTMLNKVPAITIFFWIIKVLCTTVGETVSDFLNVNLGFGLSGTSVVMGIVLAVALGVQFAYNKYVPWIYWLVVVLISVFGTLLTDNLTDNMGIPLQYSTIFFSICLMLVFLAWYASEKTLSIHSIFTRKREAFYWLAILFTFALGTATGDLLAEGLALGYATTGLIVCGIILVIAILWRLGLNGVLSFWIIYIMTRPLGASLGDYLSQTTENGGLGLGASITSLIFLAAILITIIFLSLSKKDLLPSSNQTAEPIQKGGLWQTLVVVGAMIIIAFAGYHIRSASLTNSETAAYSWSNLSEFRTIEEDVLSMVKSGDLAGAKVRVKDLETAWDNAAAYLKAADGARWTEVDDGIDAVLRSLRSSHPTVEEATKTLNSSLQQLK